RGNRPDAHHRATAPARGPGSLRHAPQPSSSAPGQEPAATGLRQDRSGRDHRPDDGKDTTPQGPGRADQQVRAGSMKLTRLIQDAAGRDGDMVLEPYRYGSPNAVERYTAVSAYSAAMASASRCGQARDQVSAQRRAAVS